MTPARVTWLRLQRRRYGWFRRLAYRLGRRFDRWAEHRAIRWIVQESLRPDEGRMSAQARLEILDHMHPERRDHFWAVLHRAIQYEDRRRARAARGDWP